MIRQPQKVLREEEAIVLDYLEHGYPMEEGMKSPIAQALGVNHLTILELVPKKGVFLQPHKSVYIGEGKREEIHHIKGKIDYERLTSTAQSELKHVIEKLVIDKEQRFVDFFNKAQPLSMRMHTLELLPGLGKKHMWEIVQTRRGKAFESFADIKTRVKLMPDPQGIIVKRIMLELKGNEKYKLFVG